MEVSDIIGIFIVIAVCVIVGLNIYAGRLDDKVCKAHGYTYSAAYRGSGYVQEGYQYCANVTQICENGLCVNNRTYGVVKR